MHQHAKLGLVMTTNIDLVMKREKLRGKEKEK